MFSIAIDGPAGAGKSTIAKKLAQQLQCVYVDTGAMYRSVGYYCMTQHIDILDEKEVSAALNHIEIELKQNNEGQCIFLNGEDVSDKIRKGEIAAAASRVATYKTVRQYLVQRQQAMAQSISIIMDGRDIGTVVLPHATLKIFLTASVEERALRRFKEYKEKGIACELKHLENEIALRDAQDAGREISPLRKAVDAIELDTTHLQIDEIVEQIHHLLKQRLEEE